MEDCLGKLEVAESNNERFIKRAFKKTKEGFRFPGGELELLTEERFPDLIDLIKICFLADEPCEKSLQMEWSPEVEELWISALRSKLCLAIADKNTKKIMGVRVIRITKNSDHTDIDQVKDEAVKKLLEFFEYASMHSNIFEKYGVTEYFEFFGLGVLPEHRRKGMATVLLQTGLNFLGHLQRPCCIKGSASSNYSKKIYDKFDFETIGEYVFEDYKVDGKVVFDKTGEHKSMKVYVKFLQ